MNEKDYIIPQMEITEFEEEDILTLSQEKDEAGIY